MPVERNIVSLEAEEKKALLISAAVSYRSAPPKRLTAYPALLSWLAMPFETAPDAPAIATLCTPRR